MLDAYIIDKIKRKDQEVRHRRHERPLLEYPAPPHMPRREEPRSQDDGERRGVVIIDLNQGVSQVV